MKYDVGLVVGKFCPLHKGHELVINTALEHSETVIIISYTSRDLGFPASQRRNWLKKRFPTAGIIVYAPHFAPHDDADDDVHRLFCARACEAIQMRPDAVFTSEFYGDGFADFLSRRWQKKVQHVMVDPARTIVPISGTALRADASLWDEYVHDDVRRIR